MARAKKSKRQAAPGEQSGVVFDEGAGPVYVEELSEQQLGIRSQALVNLMAQRDQLDAQHIAHRTEYRTKRKAMNTEISELAESVRLGRVKRPAQQELPVEADA